MNKITATYRNYDNTVEYKVEIIIQKCMKDWNMQEFETFCFIKKLLQN